MWHPAAMTIDHASLFCGDVRTRRYTAAYATRHPQYFSTTLLHYAFVREQDDVCKSWLALAMGQLKFGQARVELKRWTGSDELQDENRYWGIIGQNLITGRESKKEVVSLLSSKDRNTVVSGLIQSYHTPFHDDRTWTLVRRALLSGDAICERWALVSISNSRNFKGKELILDLIRNSHDSMTREWAAWALASVRIRPLQDDLRDCLDNERSPRVREWLYKALIANKVEYDYEFLKERLTQESDPMVKEGIVHGLYDIKGIASISFLKKQAIDVLEDLAENGSPEKEILACQLIRAFFFAAMDVDEFDRLMRVISRVPLSAKRAICAVVANQIHSYRMLNLAVQSGLYKKIHTILEQERILFNDLDMWENAVNKVFPMHLSEQVTQNVDGVTGTQVYQRAVILNTNRSRNARISQSISSVRVDGSVVQWVDIQ